MIPRATIPRSVFDLSHTHKTTFNCSFLVPVYFEEIYPGDSFNVDVNAFCRMTSPLPVPVMDDVTLDFHFFFVPTRLTWNHWQNLHGENDVTAGIPDTNYLVPIETRKNTAYTGDVADYFGIPLVQGLQYSALPIRAYWRIWNEWFRDENLQAPVPVEYGDANAIFGTWSTSVPTGQRVTSNPLDLAPRNKMHDYFTSCLPFPQKGPGVELPLSGVANVVPFGDPIKLGAYDQPLTRAYNLTNSTQAATTSPNLVATSGGSGLPTAGSLLAITNTSLGTVNGEGFSVTINSMRQAFQLQRLYERDARGGSRYTEILRSHFGVVSPDSRLQRTEFLGGFSQPIKINPVAQTSSTDSETPQANLAAFGLAATSRHGFTKSFVEHGFVIGLASVRQRPTYQQGLARFWSRRSRFDFYYPALAHLGEQAVLNKEIYAQATAADNEVFGYQERWAELRNSPNRISGLMRSTATGTLDIWHLAEKFANKPSLNNVFIKDSTPLYRVKAVTTVPDFLLDCYFKVKAARALPTYGVPGLIDHF